MTETEVSPSCDNWLCGDLKRGVVAAIRSAQDSGADARLPTCDYCSKVYYDVSNSQGIPGMDMLYRRMWCPFESQTLQVDPGVNGGYPQIERIVPDVKGGACPPGAWRGSLMLGIGIVVLLGILWTTAAQIAGHCATIGWYAGMVDGGYGPTEVRLPPAESEGQQTGAPAATAVAPKDSGASTSVPPYDLPGKTFEVDSEQLSWSDPWEAPETLLYGVCWPLRPARPGTAQATMVSALAGTVSVITDDVPFVALALAAFHSGLVCFTNAADIMPVGTLRLKLLQALLSSVVAIAKGLWGMRSAALKSNALPAGDDDGEASAASSKGKSSSNEEASNRKVSALYLAKTRLRSEWLSAFVGCVGAVGMGVAMISLLIQGQANTPGQGFSSVYYLIAGVYTGTVVCYFLAPFAMVFTGIGTGKDK